MFFSISRTKFKLFLQISLSTLIVWIILDQLARVIFSDLVYPQHYTGDDVRYPAPYIEFKGKPNALDHNEFGYRWNSRRPQEGALKIAFFGGSTGYGGAPPIADILEQKLSSRLNTSVHIANFSVVSSNHRQHLHNIIESNHLFKPDIVIFYGGYNETGQAAFYDPRPGYPYNWFFRNETPEFIQWLISRSPTIFLVDRVGVKFGLFSLTPLVSLREEVALYSQGWNDKIVDSYLETIFLAKKVSNAFVSNACNGPVEFRFFYQPYQVPPQLRNINDRIKAAIKNISYGFDVSDTFDANNKEIFTDIVHLNQDGNNAMAERMFTELINDQSLEHCLAPKGHQ